MQRLIGLPIALGILVFAAPAPAATIDVTTRADVVANIDGRCSLREAVSAANLNAASGPAAGECPAGDVVLADVVRLGSGQYVISRAGAGEQGNATGDLDVSTGPLELQGAGRERTTVSADRLDRVLDVPAGVTVTLTELTIADGAAPDGASGVPSSAGSPGDQGGGIRSAGTLTLLRSAVTASRAGRGGAGGTIGVGGHAGGAGGAGGGIRSTGALTVIDSVIAGNRAGASGPSGNGSVGSSQSPAGGEGGGISATGPTTITGSTLERNAAGAGGQGGTGGTGGGFGATGGAGGGIATSGTTTITQSTVAGNAAGSGGRGGNATNTIGGDGGAGGAGGGIATTAAPALTLTGTALVANAAGDAGYGGDGGSFGGKGGNGGSGGNLHTPANAAVVSSTLTGGAVGAGGRGGTGSAFGGGSGGAGNGSAVAGSAATSLARTVVVGTCDGAPTDGGQNLTAAAGCPGAVGDPLLSGSGMPGAGSPAIDAAGACPAVDVAGTARPQGAACDIGAFEVPAKPVTLTPDALAFAPLTAGSGASTLSVSAANPGLPGLPLPISVTGDPAFSVAGQSCPPVLLGGATCDVTVRFAPTGAGLVTGTLRLGDRTLPLSGTGLAAAVNPSPVKKCVVPKLKGKTIAAARRALVAANCRLGTVKRSGRGRVGRVRAFKPKAGSQLDAGTRVDVTVNRRRARPRR